MCIGICLKMLAYDVLEFAMKSVARSLYHKSIESE